MDFTAFTQAVLYAIFGITWTSVFLFVGVACMLVLFWRLNVNPKSKFAVEDMLLSEATQRADLYKTTIATMAALSVGTIVALLVLKQYTAVVTLLPTVLAVFVLGRGAQQIWGKAEPTAPPDVPAAPATPSPPVIATPPAPPPCDQSYKG